MGSVQSGAYRRIWVARSRLNFVACAKIVALLSSLPFGAPFALSIETETSCMDTRKKILNPEQARERIALALAAGKRCAFAQGWFDILRSEHAAALRKAKAGCDLLVVMVHADSEAHPAILDEGSRSQLVASLGSVDAVVICDKAAQAELLRSFDAVSLLDAEVSVAGSVIDEVLRRHGRK